MPTIRFAFQGFCVAEIDEVTLTATGEKMDVSNADPALVAELLNDGTYCISLGDHLYGSSKTEIEMTDFEEDD